MAKVSTDAELNSVRIKEVAAPGTPASGYFQIYAKTDGKLYTKNDAGAEVCISDLGGAAAIANSNISPTTTDVTAAANTRHFADVSGLTADRNFKLPAGTAGDVIELHVTVGHAAYEFILKGDTGITINGGSAATEWSRLFIAGEVVRFVASSATNWQVSYDGRIPCKGRLELVTTSITSNTATAWTLADWNNIGLDVGGISDATNNRFNVRRAGYYKLSGGYAPAASVTDAKYTGVSFWNNTTQLTTTILRASSTSGLLGYPASPFIGLFAVDAPLYYYFVTEEANKGLMRSDNPGTTPSLLGSVYFMCEEMLRGG